MCHLKKIIMRARPKFDSDFHSENGPWYFMGRSRRPVPLPACDFGPSGTKILLVPLWDLKLTRCTRGLLHLIDPAVLHVKYLVRITGLFIFLPQDCIG